MARKKSRQTFEKMKREQKVREKRERKEERKEASRIAKALGLPTAEEANAQLGEHGEQDVDQAAEPDTAEPTPTEV